MEQILLVIQVVIAAALIGMVLIQRSDTDGFGLGGGSGSNLLSGRATANLLTRTTAILAILFMANSLLLGVLAAHRQPASIIDRIDQEEAAPAPAEKTAPAVPNADVAPKAKKAKPPVDAANKEDTTGRTE